MDDIGIMQQKYNPFAFEKWFQDQAHTYGSIIPGFYLKMSRI